PVRGRADRQQDDAAVDAVSPGAQVGRYLWFDEHIVETCHDPLPEHGERIGHRYPNGHRRRGLPSAKGTPIAGDPVGEGPRTPAPGPGVYAAWQGPDRSHASWTARSSPPYRRFHGGLGGLATKRIRRPD